MSFTNALKWSLLSELAAKAIQPVVFIVLARLLTPEDFGVMTAAMMVIAFSQIFWEAGMSKALIQRQTHIKEAANAAFIINIGLGVLIAGLLYLCAQPIAQTFFQDDRVTAVLQVMTLQVLLGALGSVQIALLQKDMDFKKLFWVRFATVSLPGLASIPLAMNGWGYWALVAGNLVGQFAQVLMLWRMSHWRPGFTRDFVVTKEIAKFGGWVGLSGLLAWLYLWLDTLIVAKFLGVHDLGLYRVGNQISGIFFAAIIGSLLPVVYSALTRKSMAEIKHAASTGIEMISYVSVSIGVAFFFGGNLVESVFFSDEWQGVGAIISILSLTFGLTYIVAMNGEVYRAMRRPDIETFVMAIAIILYIPLYILAINHGLDIFLLARFLAGTIGVAIQIYVLKRYCEINVLSAIKTIVKILATSVVVFLPFKIASTILSEQASILLFLALAVTLFMILYFMGGKALFLKKKTI